MYDLKDEHTKEEWPDITKIYKENKRKREIESEGLEENEKKNKKKTEIEDRIVVEQQKENEKKQ